MTQRWRNWTNDTPPVVGAYLKAGGWYIKDGAGREELLVALGNPAAVTAAGVANIIAISIPVSDYYVLNDTIDFNVYFNEAVDVSTSGGTPRLQFTATSGTLNAPYVSGTGTNILVFRLTVAAGNIDLNGLVLQDNITLNSGTIRDAGTSNNATVTFTGSAFDMSGVLVDALVRTISSVDAAAGNYDTDEELDITVTFNAAVDVDVTGGVPSIPLFLNDGTTPVGDAVYASGAGTAILTFTYTVQEGDDEATAVKAGANIALNSGTITNMAGNANATVTFAQDTLTGVTLNQ